MLLILSVHKQSYKQIKVLGASLINRIKKQTIKINGYSIFPTPFPLGIAHRIRESIFTKFI